MNERTEKKWPILLLALDILGTIIAAIGILDFLKNGSLSALLLLISGLLLMLPLILYILKLLSGNGADIDKPKGES